MYNIFIYKILVKHIALQKILRIFPLCGDSLKFEPHWALASPAEVGLVFWTVDIVLNPGSAGDQATQDSTALLEYMVRPGH